MSHSYNYYSVNIKILTQHERLEKTINSKLSSGLILKCKLLANTYPLIKW